MVRTDRHAQSFRREHAKGKGRRQGPIPASPSRLVSMMVLTLPLLVTASARSQSGEPLIYSSSTKFAADGLYLDVAKVDTTDSDICKRIEAAWAALTTDSGVLDARSITGAQSCTEDPFLDVAKGTTTAHHGVLLLGNTFIQTTVPWVIPSLIEVEGIGEALKAGGGPNTVLQATTGFANNGNGTLCAQGALVCLGRNVQSFRVQLRHMTVDCNFMTSCIGIYNGAAEEGSYAGDVTVTNATAAGLEVNLARFVGGNGQNYNGGVNSGPYRNITIGFTGVCNSCGGSTAGVVLENTSSDTLNYGGIVRAFDSVTVSGANAGVTLGEGILIQGASTEVMGSHVEYFPVAIQIGGSTTPTNGVSLTNLFLSNTNSGAGVSLTQEQGGTSGDVWISGLNFQGPGNAIADAIGGNTLTDTFTALYAVGHTSGNSKPVVVTTSPSVPAGRPGPGPG